MDFPKISIITPSYNQGHFIEETILSVINQNYPNLEYIIIDGGSTDNTVDVIRKYEDKITYWISEPDSGQSDAINKGYAIASGDIINWLNSDDYLQLGSLTQIAKSFEDDRINAVTTIVTNFNENGLVWNEQTKVFQTSAEYISTAFNNQPGTFFRKSVWDLYFPLPRQLHYTMDQYIWFCYWIENSPNTFLTEDYITVNFRRHISSKTSGSLKRQVYNTLGTVFFNEHHLIFWSYFSAKRQEKADILADFFLEDFDFHSRKIEFRESILCSNTDIEEIFQLYLFQLLSEDYRLGFFNRFKKCVSFLQKEFFSEIDFKSIELKRKKISQAQLVRFYRSSYWKIKSLFRK